MLQAFRGDGYEGSEEEEAPELSEAWIGEGSWR